MDSPHGSQNGQSGLVLTPSRLFVAVFFAALFVMATREITDPDFWWHLRTGQYIVETGTIPHADVFSFTNEGQPWITHEWLAEVVLYTLYRFGGLPTLIVFFAGIIATTFALVFARSQGKPYVAALAVLLAALASAPAWGVRPQILTLLLTSLFLWILDQKRPDGSRPLLWILFPLVALWVNLHSGFALGIALVGIYLVGEVLSNLQLGARLFSLASIRALIIALLLCLVVVPVNPNGMAMYLYPFDTLGSGAMQSYIQEWFSPDFHLIEFQPFAWLLLATFGAIAISGKRLYTTQFLLLISFGYAGLRSARFIPIFALIAAPVLAEHLWSIIESRNWTKVIQPALYITRRGMLLNGLLLVLILGAASARVAMVLGNQASAESARFPTAATDYYLAHSLDGPLYNAYGWGGYLIWRTYPLHRVFIDGRADVYGDKFIEEYLSAWRGDPGWRAPLERYGIQTVMVEPTAPLAARLAGDPAWQSLYKDDQAIIYARR